MDRPTTPALPPDPAPGGPFPVIPPPVRTQARDAVARAWRTALEAGDLPATDAGVALPAVEVERPADPAHGDLASNLALKLAKPYGMPPVAIATILAAKLVREAARP